MEQKKNLLQNRVGPAQIKVNQIMACASAWSSRRHGIKKNVNLESESTVNKRSRRPASNAWVAEELVFPEELELHMIKTQALKKPSRFEVQWHVIKGSTHCKKCQQNYCQPCVLVMCTFYPFNLLGYKYFILLSIWEWQLIFVVYILGLSLICYSNLETLITTYRKPFSLYDLTIPSILWLQKP